MKENRKDIKIIKKRCMGIQITLRNSGKKYTRWEADISFSDKDFEDITNPNCNPLKGQWIL